ncbi:MAG: periplasmic nitrate reductase, NapE protein [Rhodanobacteraceae bacterium]|nr:periplasmic nitrate reductase, NapE protein [Rhodanobacteraceae bacterium]MBL0040755.1 periplasmic nitrate reductase, NapE protein [Xanthomonadales bacterium]
MDDNAVDKRRELRAFLFLTVFLAPILAVGLVASWGFIVWIFQMFAGPPGPQ